MTALQRTIHRCTASHFGHTLHNHTLMTPSAHRSSQKPSRLMATESTTSSHRPVILMDIMDTVVMDPFYEHMPKFFNMSFKQLLDSKHPSTWVEFETAQITEDECFSKFFKEGTSFDGPALVSTMYAAYDWKPNMQSLLQRLSDAGYEIHAMSNYPSWWQMIENKLQLSRYLAWTFISCQGPMVGMRKPAPECYQAVAQHLGIHNNDNNGGESPATKLLLIDDRKPNIDGALHAGWDGIVFQDALQLEAELIQRGLKF